MKRKRGDSKLVKTEIAICAFTLSLSQLALFSACVSSVSELSKWITNSGDESLSSSAGSTFRIQEPLFNSFSSTEPSMFPLFLLFFISILSDCLSCFLFELKSPSLEIVLALVSSKGDSLFGDTGFSLRL